jgi:hypothetical protein
MSLVDAKMKQSYAVMNNEGFEGGFGSATLQGVKQQINSRFKFDTMLPENRVYWENYKKQLKIVKVTEIIEEIENV